MREPGGSGGNGNYEAPARRPVYSIGAVARMLGVEASTLRAWEERYRLIVPRRSEGGQRVYSRDELDHLRFVVNAMDEGSSPADATVCWKRSFSSPNTSAGPSLAPRRW